MRYLTLLPTLMLAGCSTLLPVGVGFPDANAELMTSCPALETIDKDPVLLSEYTATVVRNYAKYHECAAVVDGWKDWHTKQKKIREAALK